jgi:hypothetical protein
MFQWTYRRAYEFEIFSVWWYDSGWYNDCSLWNGILYKHTQYILLCYCTSKSYFTSYCIYVACDLQSQNCDKAYIWLGLMVFNPTFNNISVISWRSVLLVEETNVPRENHGPAASHWQISSYNVVLSTPHLSGIWSHNVMCTDCIGSCKSNCHTITTRTAGKFRFENFSHLFILCNNTGLNK